MGAEMVGLAPWRRSFARSILLRPGSYWIWNQLRDSASRPYLLIIDQAGRGALKGALRRPGIFVGNFGSSLL
jgi:hypothetical protein